MKRFRSFDEFLGMAVWLCGYASNISDHKNGWFQHKAIREISSSCWQKHHFLHELIPWYHGEGLSEPVVLSHRYWVGSPWTSSGNLSWQDRRSMESRISQNFPLTLAFPNQLCFVANSTFLRLSLVHITYITPSLPSYEPMSTHTSQQDTPYQSFTPKKNLLQTHIKLVYITRIKYISKPPKCRQLPQPSSLFPCCATKQRSSSWRSRSHGRWPKKMGDFHGKLGESARSILYI